MKKKVCVVMSTYNGEKYIMEQVESILTQDDVEILLYIRDDGSTDNTVNILDNVTDKCNTIIDKGDNIGAKNSFIKAISDAPSADYYALSDQDDVWDKDKLITAINMLGDIDDGTPALYCSSTRLVDANQEIIKEKSTISCRDYKLLEGEIIPSAGCTMVMNKKLKKELSQYEPTTFPMHDFWIILLCIVLNGIIIYDANPHISYRQHANNTVGGKRSIMKSIKRRILFYKKMGKQYQKKMYMELMHAYESEISDVYKSRINEVFSYDQNFKNKIKLLNDKAFWHGRLKWKVETLLLVLTNNY